MNNNKMIATWKICAIDNNVGKFLQEQQLHIFWRKVLSFDGKSFFWRKVLSFERKFYLWRKVLSSEEKSFLFHTKQLSQSFYDHECVEASQLICICSNWCTSWRWLLFVCSFNLNKMNFKCACSPNFYAFYVIECI